jgi:hypothetical protein
VTVTIWWEDRLNSSRPKLFGPNQVLVACVADELGRSYSEVKNSIDGHPKKGAGQLTTGLQRDLPGLGIWPLGVVFDRDKVLDLWRDGDRPAACMSGICEAIRARAPGDYVIVLLRDNMETLVNAAGTVLGLASVRKSRDERDRILQRLAFDGTFEQRRRLREKVVDFDRLVVWTARILSTPEP